MSDEQRVVFAVSSGAYSDYRVHLVCPTREDAERVVEKMNLGNTYSYDRYDIEEMPMVSDVARRPVYRMFLVIMDDGTTRESRDWMEPEWDFEAEAKPVHFRWVRPPYLNDKGGRLEVTGTDQERVRKVFGERKALLQTDDAYRAQHEVRG